MGRRVGWKRGLLLAATAAAILGGVSFAFMLYKDRDYFHSPAYAPAPGSGARSLVVYYSRSGSTETMARQVARTMGADIHRIGCKRYSLDFAGWRHAANDARSEHNPEIQPSTLDIKKYRLIFLGAPVWLFRPAPPLWSFVEQADLSGKKVVLFNTFNSRFKQAEFDKFKARVAARGGQVVDHVWVRRGRIYYQKSGAELTQEAKQIAAGRAKRWRRLMGAAND